MSGKTRKFRGGKGSRRPINLCFLSTTGNDDMLLCDVIMMSLPVEAPTGDETSSEERDITSL